MNIERIKLSIFYLFVFLSLLTCSCTISKIKSSDEYPRIAVIDTGVDSHNKSFKKVLLKGYNSIHKDDSILDDNGHGSLMVEIIVKSTDSNIIPIKAFDSNGRSKESSINDAIAYSIESKADIILMSSSFPYLSDRTHKLIKDAYKQGIIIVASSGNESDEVSYPARFPEVIAVGSSSDNNRANYSSYGYGLDFLVPGNWSNNQEGTSISAAKLTAIISDLVTQHKGSINNQNIISYLAGLANEVREWDDEEGFGVINENSDLNNIQPHYFEYSQEDIFPFNTMVPVQLNSKIKYKLNVPFAGEAHVKSSDPFISFDLYDSNDERIVKNTLCDCYRLEKGNYFFKPNMSDGMTRTFVVIEFKLSQDIDEDNNTFQKATSLYTQSIKRISTFHSEDDTDYYLIPTVLNTVTVEVESIWGYNDLAISLYDKEKNKILEVDDLGVNANERFELPFKNQVYYLQIENKLKSKDTAYLLTGSW